MGAKSIGDIIEYAAEMGEEHPEWAVFAPLKELGANTSGYWKKHIEANAPRIQNFTDIDWGKPADIIDWAAGSIGQMAGQMVFTAPFMYSRAAAASAKVGVTGWQALKGLFAEGNVKQFGRWAGEWAKPKMMDIPIGIQEAGQVLGGQLERIHKGETTEIDPVRALAATFVATKLEELGAENTINRLFKTGTTGVQGKLFRRIGRQAIATGAGEGTEEFFQQYAEQAGIDPSKLGTKETFMDAVNGAAAGFVGGYAMGAGAGGVSSNKKTTARYNTLADTLQVKDDIHQWKTDGLTDAEITKRVEERIAAHNKMAGEINATLPDEQKTPLVPEIEPKEMVSAVLYGEGKFTPDAGMISQKGQQAKTAVLRSLGMKPKTTVPSATPTSMTEGGMVDTTKAAGDLGSEPARQETVDQAEAETTAKINRQKGEDLFNAALSDLNAENQAKLEQARKEEIVRQEAADQVLAAEAQQKTNDQISQAMGQKDALRVHLAGDDKQKQAIFDDVFSLSEKRLASALIKAPTDKKEPGPGINLTTDDRGLYQINGQPVDIETLRPLLAGARMTAIDTNREQAKRDEESRIGMEEQSRKNKTLALARKMLPYYPAQRPSEQDMAILQEAATQGKLTESELKILGKIRQKVQGSRFKGPGEEAQVQGSRGKVQVGEEITSVIPASASVIPAASSVIPAEAGIQSEEVKENPDYQQAKELADQEKEKEEYLLDLMKSQLENAGTAAMIEKADGTYGKLPAGVDWLTDVNKEGIATSKADALAVIQKAKAGASMTERQQTIYDAILAAAKNRIPDRILDEPYWAKKGFEKVRGNEIAAKDLLEGDQFVIADEVFTVTDIDEEGNVTLKDGTIRKVKEGTVIKSVDYLKQAEGGTEFLPEDLGTEVPAKPEEIPVTEANKETPPKETKEVSPEGEIIEPAASLEATPEVKKKESWEMTQDEFLIAQNKDAWERAYGVNGKNSTGETLGEYVKSLRATEDGGNGIGNEATHHKLVREALSEGKQIPEEVLREYPDLIEEAATAGEKETSAAFSKETPEDMYANIVPASQTVPESETPAVETPKAQYSVEEKATPAATPVPRSKAIPTAAGAIVTSYYKNDKVSAHANYKKAKSGDMEAAAHLVMDMVKPETVENAKARFGEGAIYVAPHAIEQKGENMIPTALARYYADLTGGTDDTNIVQDVKAFHTGAGAMERLVSRVTFDGDVVKGGKYVLVDDVSTMAGTLAELTHHIQSNGGEVAGIITLTNASRSKTITPHKNLVKNIERKFGDEIRELFGIEPKALTAAEAGYIINFRDADSLRNRAAKAIEERRQRLLSKEIRTSATEEVKPPEYDTAPAKAKLSEPQLKDLVTDLTKAVKGIKVAETEGRFYIETKNGHYVRIMAVEQIEPDRIALKLGYGDEKANEKPRISGAYYSTKTTQGHTIGDINLVMDASGSWTLSHEFYHFLEDTGAISNADKLVMNNKISALMAKDPMKWGYLAGRKLSEARADWVGKTLAGVYDAKTPTGKILAKIKNFIDTIINALGIRTSGGVIRDIKSGNVFEEGSRDKVHRKGTRFRETEKEFSVTKEQMTKKTGPANIPAKENPKAGAERYYVAPETYSEKRGGTGSFHNIWRIYDKETGGRLSKIYTSQEAAESESTRLNNTPQYALEDVWKEKAMAPATKQTSRAVAAIFGKLPSRMTNKLTPEKRDAAREFYRQFKEFFVPGSLLPNKDAWLAERAAAMGKNARALEFIDTLFGKLNYLPMEIKKEMFQVLDGRIPVETLPETVRVEVPVHRGVIATTIRDAAAVVGKEPPKGRTVTETVNPRDLARMIRARSDTIGQIMVDMGMLKEENFKELEGRYVHYLYAYHVMGDGASVVVGSNGRLNLTETMARNKNLTDRQRAELGLIEDASVAVPIGMGKALTDIAKWGYLAKVRDNTDWVWEPSVVDVPIGKTLEKPVKGRNRRMIKMGIGELVDEVKKYEAMSRKHPSTDVNEHYRILKEALDKAEEATKNVPADFKQLANSRVYGPLAGTFVRQTIYDDLVPVLGQFKEGMAPATKTVMEITNKAMAGFKIGKVALNPPTMARNVISNIIQINMSGRNLVDILGTDLPRAVESVRAKDQYYHEAYDMGIFHTNWFAAEINDVLDEFRKAESGRLDKVLTMAKNLSKFYGRIDDFFKLAIYRQQREAGKSIDQAAVHALKWGMDYSLATPFIKTARRFYMPFSTYSYKIAPLIAESIKERPWVIAKYMLLPKLMQMMVMSMFDLDDDDWEKLERQLPEYIKKSGSVMIMPWRTDKGNYQWLNLEYFFPWGNWFNMFRDAKRMDIGEFTRDLGLSNPLLDLLTTFRSARDGSPPTHPFFGNTIYNKLDPGYVKAAKMMEYVAFTFLPSAFMPSSGAARMSWDYLSDKEDRWGKKITFPQAFFRWFGANITTVSPEQTAAIGGVKIQDMRKELARIEADPSVSEEKKADYRERFNKELAELAEATPTAVLPILRQKGEDPVFQTLKDMAAKGLLRSAPPTRTVEVGGIPLKMTIEQYRDYLEKSSEIAHRKLLNLVESDTWETMPDGRKSTVVKEIITNARKGVRQRIKVQVAKDNQDKLKAAKEKDRQISQLTEE